jgi:hypothetical protein
MWQEARGQRGGRHDSKASPASRMVRSNQMFIFIHPEKNPLMVTMNKGIKD